MLAFLSPAFGVCRSLCLLLLVLLAGPGWCQLPPRPDQHHYLVDQAHVLSWQGDTDIDQMLARVAAETNWQLYVLTLPSLDKDKRKPEVEQYAQTVAEQWGLARQAKTGLLLLDTGANTASIWTTPDLNDSLPRFARSLILEQGLRPALAHEQDSSGLCGAIQKLCGWALFNQREGIGSQLQYDMLVSPAGFDDSDIQDFAYLFSPQEKKALQRQAAQHARHDSSRVVVLTVATLCSMEKANYALDLARFLSNHNPRYGLVFILLAEKDREMRICTSFSAVLSDQQAKGMIDSILVPAFKQQHYYAGIRDAISRLHVLQKINLQAVRAEQAAGEREPWLLIGLAVLFCCSIPFWGHHLRQSPRPWYASSRSSSFSGGGSSSGSLGSGGGSSWGGGGASGSW